MLALVVLIIAALGLIGLWVYASQAPGHYINLEEFVSLLAMPAEHVPEAYWEMFSGEHMSLGV